MQVLRRRDGRQLVRTTVYLPASISRALARRALEEDIDRSDLVAQALEAMLGPLPAAEASSEPAEAATPPELEPTPAPGPAPSRPPVDETPERPWSRHRLGLF